MDATSIQHPPCWGNLKQIEDVTHCLRKNCELQRTTYVKGQISKHFVRSNGNIVLSIPESFFVVRPINHLKTIYCRK